MMNTTNRVREAMPRFRPEALAITDRPELPAILDGALIYTEDRVEFQTVESSRDSLDSESASALAAIQESRAQQRKADGDWLREFFSKPRVEDAGDDETPKNQPVSSESDSKRRKL